MTKRVLSVGQCLPDHLAIEQFLKSRFDVEVVAAEDEDETRRRLADEWFDLVLINRKLDGDSSDGIEIIRRLKADPATAAVPVMLVTNFPEHDRTAVEAGAAPGFGKRELANPATADRLRPYLDHVGVDAT
jgi:two-component system chemotaxis response regulator CheY